MTNKSTTTNFVHDKVQITKFKPLLVKLKRHKGENMFDQIEFSDLILKSINTQTN